MKKKILFLGGASLLAHSWCKSLRYNKNIILGIHNRKPELENFNTIVVDINNLENQIFNLKGDIIINCIGYTNVENCEISEKARKINVDYASIISKVCNNLSIKLVHISTDHLFDGKSRFYAENDKVSPLNEYGKTKSKAEKIILKNNSSSLIVRTNFWSGTIIQKFIF